MECVCVYASVYPALCVLVQNTRHTERYKDLVQAPAPPQGPLCDSFQSVERETAAHPAGCPGQSARCGQPGAAGGRGTAVATAKAGTAAPAFARAPARRSYGTDQSAQVWRCHALRSKDGFGGTSAHSQAQSLAARP